MWNLTPLVVNDYREHLNVAFPVGAIPENVSEAEKDKLLELYKFYEQTLGRPAADLTGAGTKPELAQFVHDAYDLVQDGRRLASLRSALKLQAESCPYCGYGPIEELDHFLQRSHYKLFSIFPLNLVPCCGTCNRTKRRNPSAAPNEHQIHVYLEDISGYDFLRTKVNISPDSGGLQVRYFVEQSEGMPNDVYSRLVHHLTEFGLEIRYEKQVNIFLGELGYSIKTSYEDGGSTALKRYLVGNSDALKKRFGVNDWRTALMRGLSKCAAFYEGG